MPGAIAKLSASLRWDTDEFDRGTRHIEGAFGKLRGIAEGLSNTFASLGRKATLGITAPLVALSGFSIKAASDAAELQSAYDYTFGNLSNMMNKWAVDTGNAMGRSTSEMQKGALAMGQLFKQAAPTEQAAARLSQKFAMLGQDVASFYNLASADEAFDKLRAGLVGEAEPLRQFGIFMTAAAVEAKGLEMGLIKVGQELTEEGKIMARAAIIAEGLADATGDVERTSSSFANQVRALKAEIQELATEIGERMRPYAEKLIGWLRSMVIWIKDLPDGVKNAAAGIAVFAAALGPLSLLLSSLVITVLPLFIMRFGLIGQIIVAIINPIGTALVYLARFATSWTLIGAALSRIVPFFLRLLGPIGLVITAVLLFKDNIIDALGNVWAKMKEVLGPKLEAMFAQLGDAMSAVGEIFTLISDSPIGEFLRLVIGLIGDLIGWFIELGGTAVIAALSLLIDMIGAVAEYVTGLANIAKAVLQGDWQGAWDAAVGVVGRAALRIADWIKTIFPTLSLALEMLGRLTGADLTIKSPKWGGSNTNQDPATGYSDSNLPFEWKGDNLKGRDYALAGSGPKARKGSSRTRSGPTAAELAERKETLRLQQALAVAREKDDIEAERSLQRQIDLRSRIAEYERAGLEKKAASVAAEKDMVELAEARAIAQARAIDQEELQIDLQLAELRGDYEHLRQLEDEEFLERRIAVWRQKGLDLIEAEKRAQQDLLFLEQARGERLQRRLADQERERQLELARIRGDDPNRIRAMEEDLRRGDRAAELMRDFGLSEPDAIAKATREGIDRSRAHLQGTFRDTFRDGLQAALNGNLKGFFENWIKQRTFDALSNVLDRLADRLADLIAGSRNGGDGGGGIIGTIGGILGLSGGGGDLFKNTSLSGSSFSSSKSISSGKSVSGGKTPGFATGGRFTIKGFSGIDTNLLSLNGNPIARVSTGEIMNIKKGNDNDGTSAPYFDLRGAVVTQDLLDQMNEIGRQAAAQGGAIGSQAAQTAMSRAAGRSLE